MSNTTLPSSDASPSGRSERNVLPVHPAAELFPIMAGAELVELGNDIKKHGLQLSIVIYVDPDGKEWLLEGRSRLAAMEIVGIEFKLQRNRFGWEIDITSEGEEYDAVRDPPDLFGTRTVKDIDPYDYVISANIHRRHLTAELKRDLIGKLLKANPAKSDRAIGRTVRADNKTVESVRADLEGREEIPHVETRKDTRGRAQPAKKAKAKLAAIDAEVTTDAATSTEVRKAAYAAEEQQLDNVGDADCPGREPAKVAMMSLCWLILADSDDPELAEHLATIAAAQSDPFPVSAVEKVIALLTKVAARLRVKQVHTLNLQPNKQENKTAIDQRDTDEIRLKSEPPPSREDAS
jgi:hypothetical protein